MARRLVQAVQLRRGWSTDRWGSSPPALEGPRRVPSDLLRSWVSSLAHHNLDIKLIAKGSPRCRPTASSNPPSGTLTPCSFPNNTLPVKCKTRSTSKVTLLSIPSNLKCADDQNHHVPLDLMRSTMSVSARCTKKEGTGPSGTGRPFREKRARSCCSGRTRPLFRRICFIRLRISLGVSSLPSCSPSTECSGERFPGRQVNVANGQKRVYRCYTYGRVPPGRRGGSRL